MKNNQKHISVDRRMNNNGGHDDFRYKIQVAPLPGARHGLGLGLNLDDLSEVRQNIVGSPRKNLREREMGHFKPFKAMYMWGHSTFPW